jgi:2-dehydro-3-deoxyphosphogluconate aldolase/(4S)-4-hydroxy-2-oxoglutarate aldolase
LAWSQEPWWLELLQTLPNHWPDLRFGVAGVRWAEQLVVAHGQGLRFAMSPISCPVMWEQADALGLTLVPGVWSPSEVHRAGARGAVKLFPAASLGPSYWRQLRGPMAPLPFCIAAGGLRPADLSAWFASGVEAVALGSTLLMNKTCCLRATPSSLSRTCTASPPIRRRCRSESQVLHLGMTYICEPWQSSKSSSATRLSL